MFPKYDKKVLYSTEITYHIFLNVLASLGNASFASRGEID